MFMPDNSLIVPRGMRQYIIDLAKAEGILCEIQDDRKHYPIKLAQALFKPAL